MQKSILTVIFLFCFSSVDAAIESTPTADELVSIIDGYRGLGPEGFSMQTTTISYKPNTEAVTVKVDVDVLGYKSKVTFLSPARERGRVLLSSNNNIWLYFPGTSRVVRISPAQKLLGETSNSDILGIAYAMDYNPAILGHIDFEGKTALHLRLKSTNRKASYDVIEFYLDVDTGYRPLKSDYYTKSGKKLKTAFYKEFMDVNGQPKIHKILFTNPLIEGSFTWMQFNNMQFKSLSDSQFNKNSLSN